MALLSQSSFLQASVHCPPRNLMMLSLPIKHLSTCQNPLSSLPIPNKKKLRFITLASVSPSPTLTSKHTQTPTQSLINESTHTLRMLLSLTLSASILFAKAIQNLALRISHTISLNTIPQELAAIRSLQGNLLCSAGPLFFAAMRSQRSGHLNTPLTVVAVGLAKWLDIYGGLVMVRVLLSWFPSIPWERQPLSAIRDLCDPFLNLFRNIIPPIFGTLDVSPLLAFAVMGVLGSILKNSTKV